MKSSETVLMAAIGLAVLAFGGTEPASFAVAEILLFGIAAWHLATAKNWSNSIPPWAFWIPAALVAVVLIQLCPLSASLSYKIGSAAGEFSSVHNSRLSIEAFSTRSELLILVACLAGFFLVQLHARDRNGQKRFVIFLIALGIFEAFYGLVQYLAGWQKIFFYVKKYDLEEATGTYINRNHYAGFLEMVLPFSLALALYEFGKLRRNPTGTAARLRTLLAQAGFQRVVLYLFISALLFGALFFSRSRMGIVAASASALAMFALAGISGRRGRTALLLSVAFVLLASSLAVWIGPGPIAERFANVSQEYSQYDQSRLSIWRGTWTLIREHPLLGSGLGTFPIAFTQVQDTFLGEFVNHAHNDYLELASDLGLPAALVLFGSVFYLLGRAVRNFFCAERSFERCVALACVGSVLAILLHSLTDFNLYIPANALLFATILGLSLTIRSARTPAERDLA